MSETPKPPPEPGPTIHELIQKHLDRFDECAHIGYPEELLLELLVKALEENKPIPGAEEYYGYGPDILI